MEIMRKGKGQKQRRKKKRQKGGTAESGEKKTRGAAGEAPQKVSDLHSPHPRKWDQLR